MAQVVADEQQLELVVDEPFGGGQIRCQLRSSVASVNSGMG